MKVYLTTACPDAVHVLRDLSYPYVLLSFAYARLLEHYAAVWHQKGSHIKLDSGAFTAWNTGGKVNLIEYKDWCHSIAQRFPDRPITCINLDVIPGEKGRASTQSEREDGIAQSLINADRLRSAGLPIVEVFHQDEPFSLLETLVERLPVKGTLALSPRNDVSVQRREKWLRSVTGYWMKNHGKTFPKAHGLAVTGKSLMKAYPFYSVDSSSWATCARYGASKAAGLHLPSMKKDKQRAGLKSVSYTHLTLPTIYSV